MAKTLTAADVRAYFRAKPERLSALSEAAQHTVAEGARGKVHPDAIKAFNAKRRKDSRYVVGASKVVAEKSKADAQARRAALAAAGHKVGTRGPLPKALVATSKA